MEGLGVTRAATNAAFATVRSMVAVFEPRLGGARGGNEYDPRDERETYLS